MHTELTQRLQALSAQELIQVSAAGAAWANDWDFVNKYEASMLNNPQFAAWMYSQWVHHVAEEHSGPTDTTSAGKPPARGL